MVEWSWWITNLLHIETIAFIFFIAVLLYLYFSGNKSLLDKWAKVSSTTVPNKLISKRKKKNAHEEECRKIFEKLFNCKFKCVRPDWLANPATGRNLELDGFNPNIETPLGRGLAFEYDGAQHAGYTSYFHRKGPREFEYQLKKDSWKDMRCKEKGVLLIRIPHYVNFDSMEQHIKAKLFRCGMLGGRSLYA